MRRVVTGFVEGGRVSGEVLRTRRLLRFASFCCMEGSTGIVSGCNVVDEGVSIVCSLLLQFRDFSASARQTSKIHPSMYVSCAEFMSCLIVYTNTIAFTDNSLSYRITTLFNPPTTQIFYFVMKLLTLFATLLVAAEAFNVPSSMSK